MVSAAHPGSNQPPLVSVPSAEHVPQSPGAMSPGAMSPVLLPKPLDLPSEASKDVLNAPTGIERLTLAWLRQANTQHFHCRQAALVAFLVISMRPPRRHLALQLLHLPQADL